MHAGDVKLGVVFANDHAQHPALPAAVRLGPGRKLGTTGGRRTTSHTGSRAGARTREASGVLPKGGCAAGAASAAQAPREFQHHRRTAAPHRIAGALSLVSARAAASEAGADSVSVRVAGLFKNREQVLHEEHPDGLYKLWQLPQDRIVFLRAVRRPTDLRASPAPEHRLTRARLWFEGEMHEWASIAPDAAHRLDALHFALQERMQLGQITLNAGDDPQVIFEALNQRGVRRAAARLVKNWLFQTVGTPGDLKRAEALLADRWLPLDAKQWRAQNEAQVRPSRDAANEESKIFVDWGVLSAQRNVVPRLRCRPNRRHLGAGAVRGRRACDRLCQRTRPWSAPLQPSIDCAAAITLNARCLPAASIRTAAT